MAQHRKLLITSLLGVACVACLGGLLQTPNLSLTWVDADAIAVVRAELSERAEEVQLPSCEQGDRSCDARLDESIVEKLGLQRLVDDGVWTAELNLLNSRWRVTVVLGDNRQSYRTDERTQKVIDVPDQR